MYYIDVPFLSYMLVIFPIVIVLDIYVCRIKVNLFVNIRTPIKSLTEVPFKLKLDTYRFILKLFIAK
jgi:hypothetical protein